MTGRVSTRATPTAEQLLTKDEAAALLKVTTRFIERCVAERRIRYVRVGRFIRIPMSAIEDLVAAGTVEPLAIRVRPAGVRRLVQLTG